LTEKTQQQTLHQTSVLDETILRIILMLAL